MKKKANLASTYGKISKI